MIRQEKGQYIIKSSKKQPKTEQNITEKHSVEKQWKRIAREDEREKMQPGRWKNRKM